MTKPLTPADEPTLFPSEWVIGRAAADLVREDEGVLLDEVWLDPLAGRPARGRTSDAPQPLPAPEQRVHTERPLGPVSARGPASAGFSIPPDADLAAVLTSPEEETSRRYSHRPTAAEIEELKASQARLRRRLEAARARARPRYVGVSEAGADGEPAMIAEAPLPVARRRSFPWRSIALTLVVAALASGLYQYRAVLFQF